MPRGGYREGGGRPPGTTTKVQKAKAAAAYEDHRAGLQRVMTQELTEDDIRDVIAGLKKLVKGGHYKAAELLLGYGLGRPEVTSTVNLKGEIDFGELSALASDVRTLLPPPVKALTEPTA